MQGFADYHAHVYFDAEQGDEARALCVAMREALGVPMGRVHTAPVGPHPRGSCQMTVPASKIAEAIAWIMRNRGVFTVFAHGNSGHDLLDHTAHVMWFGPSKKLDTSQFGTD
ncbi:4,5-dioxygenase [Novosphingobium sp. AAP83]|uniref:DOPA 4,5-dioxygenase family protein n=1 Tax=Novosphingobium sp. AAP83 TaxID=1523425 RepID=UPI0006B97EA9|nr:DOPA 4,5-dioxygenase family protein [Novosphingobium sp. AAP83]KPF91617.1 4,5-dioxygenase [Novosphingobium sp. AAP83]